MKNPLTELYIDQIKRSFYKNYDPNEGYEWEDFKNDFKRHTGYNFDSLKDGSFIKAKYLFDKYHSKVKRELNDGLISFEKERGKYYDDNGILIDKKWKDCVENANALIEEANHTKPMNFFKEYFNDTGKEISGELSESLTYLFEELQTYQTRIQVYVDEELEKISILIVDYNPDCYDADDALYKHYGKLYTTSERYWPKDKYQEMEKAKKKYINTKIYLPKVVDEFPYAVGTDGWIKHYFSKLPPKKLEDYKKFTFLVNFIVCSPITAYFGKTTPKYFVDGKLEWDS